ncbi:hypothetical protein JKP76_14065 [Blastococcus sp. TML/C7B]|nr:hypothetical protein [Blastococcus sp. TML/C7B]
MTEPRRQVLVAFATASGSTREIAERIGGRLRAVADVAMLPAGPGVELDRFDAFVIGSAVHDMAWLPPARGLAQRLAPVVRGRPVWFFSVAGIDPRGRRPGRGWRTRRPRASPGGCPASCTRATTGCSAAWSGWTGFPCGDGSSTASPASTPATSATGPRSTRGPTRSPVPSRRRRSMPAPGEQLPRGPVATGTAGIAEVGPLR